MVPFKQKKRKRESDASTFASHICKFQQASISKKRRKEKPQRPAIDSSTLPKQASKLKERKKKKRHLAVDEDSAARCGVQQLPKQASKLKERRKKKRHLAVDEDSAARYGAQQHVVHVGKDLTNSNWKQLEAILKKGQAATKNQSRIHKEQAVGADITKSGKFQTKHIEVATQRPLEILSPKNEECSLTKVLAMDCEMVGAGLDGKRSILARVSLVNMWGNVVYDKHVRPREHVTDYRTYISGVRAGNLRKGEEFAVVQKEVSELMLGRVLVGHSLRNDLKILYLSHPKKDIRDTAAYPPLRNTNGRPRALRHIAADLLGVKIQVGEHCSVEDARAAMYIYQHLKQEWEATMRKRHKT